MLIFFLNNFKYAMVPYKNKITTLKFEDIPHISSSMYIKNENSKTYFFKKILEANHWSQ